ncbi:MAG TPA: Fic family protein [bacterium]|nr:Fic family protein [bacterium]
MDMKKMMWKPVFSYTDAIVNKLMALEALKNSIVRTNLPSNEMTKLKHEAKIRSTHYSTGIEGNLLTLTQARQVIDENKVNFKGRDRDVKEVARYWDALTQVENWANNQKTFSEEMIKKLHAIVEKGKRAKGTEYRKEQNVIKDAVSGRIVYMPPEAKDVTRLMKEMVAWVKEAERQKLPAPVIAALVHYQFVTLHPYYDGNGRTARLLSTYILFKHDYGLDGMFSLEEYHAIKLAEYYKALSMHQGVNYYMGGEKAKLNPWVEYFIDTLYLSYEDLRSRVEERGVKGKTRESELIRQLDRRAREIYPLFDRQDMIFSKDVARILKISTRTARERINEWIESGFLEKTGASNKNAAYRLGKKYR